jgi:polysaccharide biosynthesis transport protein
MDDKKLIVQLGAPAWLDAHLRDVLDGKNNLLGQFIARWKTLGVVFISCLVLGLCVLLNIQKQYTATAVLVIDPRRSQIIEGFSSLVAMQWDALAVSNEVALLQLPELGIEVVRHLRLTLRPEYRRDRRPKWFAWGDVPEDSAMIERQDEDFARAQLTRTLRVTNEPRTHTIRVSYTSVNARHAAEVANAFTELHISAQRKARMQSIREASSWLNREIGALQERISNAEDAEAAYRRQHRLGDDRVASTAQQEVNALLVQVTSASAERAQAEAKLQEPTAGIMTSLEEAARIANEREANVRRRLDDAQKRLNDVLAAEAGLRALARESSASRLVLEDLLRRARTADSQIDAPRPEARIASRALVPTIPSGLGLSRLVPAATVGSAAVAVAVVFLLIRLQSGFRSLEEAERRLGVEGIVEVPKIRGGARRMRQLIVERPSCPIAEAVRSICGRLSDGRVPCPVILVTSPVPGDGKTALATALAQTFAMTSRNCLFVDADFRRPSAHRVFGVPSAAGLCEVLAGSVPFDKALTKVLPGPLTFLSAGEVVRDPLELLSPSRLASFIDTARKRFDIVILDSPPVLPISDAGLIASYATHVLLALRWASTTRAAAARAIMLLRRQHPDPPLLVLTRVDQIRTSRYEEGRYGMDLSYAGRPWTRNGEASGRG